MIRKPAALAHCGYALALRTLRSARNRTSISHLGRLGVAICYPALQTSTEIRYLLDATPGKVRMLSNTTCGQQESFRSPPLFLPTTKPRQILRSTGAFQGRDAPHGHSTPHCAGREDSTRRGPPE